MLSWQPLRNGNEKGWLRGDLSLPPIGPPQPDWLDVAQRLLPAASAVSFSWCQACRSSFAATAAGLHSLSQLCAPSDCCGANCQETSVFWKGLEVKACQWTEAVWKQPEILSVKNTADSLHLLDVNSLTAVCKSSDHFFLTCQCFFTVVSLISMYTVQVIYTCPKGCK